MKVIFLDVDGVLNSQNFHKSGRDKNAVQWKSGGKIDAEGVARLDKLVKATDAKIVISSSWRHSMNPFEMKHALRHMGLTTFRNVIDRTPVGMGIRGEEIQEWLDLDPERARVWTDHEPVDAYVILDDNNDMLPEQQEHFVHVDSSIGLTDENVVDAIAILRLQ